jgi:hypothetical protein
VLQAGRDWVRFVKKEKGKGEKAKVQGKGSFGRKASSCRRPAPGKMGLFCIFDPPFESS